MRRRVTGILGAFVLLAGLAAWGSAASPADAATTHVQARDIIVEFPDQATWAADTNYCWQLNDLGVMGIEYTSDCWLFYIPNNGYSEIQEVSLNSGGLFGTDGNCLAWNGPGGYIDIAPCNVNSEAERWAGTGTSPDLIWNQYVEYNTPDVCPLRTGGYTQQVITGEIGSVLDLACPLDIQEQEYTPAQEFYIASI